MSEFSRSIDSCIVLKRYQALADCGKIRANDAQYHLAQCLDRLMDELIVSRRASRAWTLGRLFARAFPAKPPRGLYIWGGVGSGKSMLMDLFFEQIPIEQKRRVHFHEFMQEIHQWLRTHRRQFALATTKQKDPILSVAARIFDESKLICFDEFVVHDITDAMILGRLFTALFDLGLVMVSTSNVTPEYLYHNGLNRQLFIPFIRLLQSRVDVVELSAPIDYRLSKDKRLPVYNMPLTLKSAMAMDEAWLKLTGVKSGPRSFIESGGRRIDIPESKSGVARFSFTNLCAMPLAAADYLLICDRFHTILIDKIPQMDQKMRNEARRFIILVDLLYEARTYLVASAAAPPDQLYQGKIGTESFEFTRTASRLIEMQSSDYLYGANCLQGIYSHKKTSA